MPRVCRSPEARRRNPRQSCHQSAVASLLQERQRGKAIDLRVQRQRARRQRQVRQIRIMARQRKIGAPGENAGAYRWRGYLKRRRGGLRRQARGGRSCHCPRTVLRPALMVPTSPSLGAAAVAPFCTVMLLVWVGSPTWTMPKSIGEVVRTFATAGVYTLPDTATFLGGTRSVITPPMACRRT